MKLLALDVESLGMNNIMELNICNKTVPLRWGIHYCIIAKDLFEDKFYLFVNTSWYNIHKRLRKKTTNKFRQKLFLLNEPKLVFSIVEEDGKVDPKDAEFQDLVSSTIKQLKKELEIR